jgi:DNA adenine methylase
MQVAKSPLRYPGGKSKALDQISECLPLRFTEFREPFVGGGSVFIYIRQKFPQVKVWINDLNQELYCFWNIAQTDVEKLIEETLCIKRQRRDGKKLFAELTTTDVSKLSEFERAVRFFVLNRITFSGTVESGGFSQGAFEKRFTYSAIERLAPLSDILQGVRITNFDYKEVLGESGEGVFVFLDPPYLNATKSRLYGKRGMLHTTFNHDEFANCLRDCTHQWLATYDDSIQIRKNFDFAKIYEWQLQYGMNNYKQENCKTGKELFVTNYQFHPKRKELQASLFV